MVKAAQLRAGLLAAPGSGSGGQMEVLGFRAGTLVGQMDDNGRPVRDKVAVET